VSTSDTQPSRRDFTRAVAALAAAPLVLAPDEAVAQGAGDPALAVTDALFEIARARFGKHLSEEQLRELKRGIYRDQRGADYLRRVKLQNSDEPAVVFRADVS